MKIRDLTAAALFAAVICVLAPFGFNIGPIPITLATFAIYLAAAVLGWKWGTLAVLVYILLGMVGVPVFSNFGAGFSKIVGPTGGYIVGYLPCAIVAGLFADRFEKLWAYVVGMLLGTVVLYVFGTAWFCIVSSTPLDKALGLCVIPFLPGDGIKIALASVIAVKLRPVVKNIRNKAKA